MQRLRRNSRPCFGTGTSAHERKRTHAPVPRLLPSGSCDDSAQLEDIIHAERREQAQRTGNFGRPGMTEDLSMSRTYFEWCSALQQVRLRRRLWVVSRFGWCRTPDLVRAKLLCLAAAACCCHVPLRLAVAYMLLRRAANMCCCDVLRHLPRTGALERDSSSAGHGGAEEAEARRGRETPVGSRGSLGVADPRRNRQTHPNTRPSLSIVIVTVFPRCAAWYAFGLAWIRGHRSPSPVFCLLCFGTQACLGCSRALQRRPTA